MRAASTCTFFLSHRTTLSCPLSLKERTSRGVSRPPARIIPNSAWTSGSGSAPRLLPSAGSSKCAATWARQRSVRVGTSEGREEEEEEEDDAGACDAGCECDCIDFARPAPLSLADADAFMSTYSARRPATRGRCSGLAALAADTQVNQRATNPAC